MSLSELNNTLFLWINASVTPSPFLLKSAIFISHDLIGVYLGLCTILLVKTSLNYKRAYLHSILMVLIGVCIAAIIDHFYYHPRPFVLRLGHLLVSHAANNSFPSHHMLTISILAFSFLYQDCKKLGTIGMLIAALVGWSRVYLGVHFPLDILGGILMAFVIVNVYIQSRKILFLKPPQTL
ncbi:undecaprenyl-diphosphatase [Acinetobacter sp. S40]|uniref:undecaprenyl-diphosphatase n=1 Tax=unclassified Acinetobacter TaxID=196816 RepID=UPI00190D8759|nr:MULTISPECIES: undecaprenyl-diphosphatase [unclassified Acinetobacter]MBJ9985730.1 undecaprenyl-diphosphatase [Acinetobacter sp. S40]MBK0064948.1 undecaprenyl-diphosphatase [Acinetobacter sp. S55]MBK0067361.1 undecaprenyl-diphosphatase [Acinetobacter sp. S54]